MSVFCTVLNHNVSAPSVEQYDSHVAPSRDYCRHGINDRQLMTTIVGYEPADLTVHPPQNDRGWVHFFRMGV